MITIVVASFGALSPRRVIVPRQSKQVTSSSRQHQKLRFPSAMAASPNGMSDTSNSGWCHSSVKELLFVTVDTQSEKRQASDSLVGRLCLLQCTCRWAPPASISAGVKLTIFFHVIWRQRMLEVCLHVPLTLLSCRGVYVHCKWNNHCAYKKTRVLRCLRFIMWKVIMS